MKWAVIATHPTRFRGVAVLPTVDPEAMVAELHRAVKQLGFVGAYVAVSPAAKRMGHPGYEHLYKAIVELDVTLWLHPARPPSIPDYTDEKIAQYYEWQLVGWPYDTTSAMFRIVFSGVFDRYPGIRIVTHHHGALIPLLAPRLDNVWPLMETAWGCRCRRTYPNPIRTTSGNSIAIRRLPVSRQRRLSLRSIFWLRQGLVRIGLAVRYPGRSDIYRGDLAFNRRHGGFPETRLALLSKNAARILKLG